MKTGKDRLIQFLKNHPEKYLARNYTYKHKLRGKFCADCKSSENLEFHHINYEENEGLTLCMKCHKKLERLKNEE